MKRELNDAFVMFVKADKGARLEVRDMRAKGLVLRVTPGGSKSWGFLYRRQSDGRRRRVTIGAFPQINAEYARIAACELQAAVDGGGDPAGTVAVQTAEPTYGAFAADYIENHAKARNRSWATVNAMLDRDVIPEIGAMRLSAVRQGDVRRILAAIERRGAPTQACRTLEVIRRSFNLAIDNNYLAVNPCSGIVLETPQKANDRNLLPDEIKRFWEQIGSARMAWGTQQILRLCLVTGQSVGDVAGARKYEIDLDEGVWEIPSSRSRNRVAHRVHLSPLALRLFGDAVRASGDGDCVFPGRDGAKALTGHAVAKAMRRNLTHFQLNRVTPRDLSRAAASGMAELGIARLTIAKTLNHISKDRSVNTDTYDKYEYEREKRIALESWTNRLQEIIGGGTARNRERVPWR